MSSIVVTRRGVLSSFGAFAAAGLSGCNTTQSPAVAAGAAPVGYRIASIVVDTSPLAGQSGEQTAQWAQQAMPGALAQALAAHMAPGDPSGGTLSVVVNSIYLGGGGPADADRIGGVATVNGRQVPVPRGIDVVPEPGRSVAGRAVDAKPGQRPLRGVRLSSQKQAGALSGRGSAVRRSGAWRSIEGGSRPSSSGQRVR